MRNLSPNILNIFNYLINLSYIKKYPVSVSQTNADLFTFRIKYSLSNNTGGSPSFGCVLINLTRLVPHHKEALPTSSKLWNSVLGQPPPPQWALSYSLRLQYPLRKHLCAYAKALTSCTRQSSTAEVHLRSCSCIQHWATTILPLYPPTVWILPLTDPLRMAEFIQERGREALTYICIFLKLKEP